MLQALNVAEILNVSYDDVDGTPSEGGRGFGKQGIQRWITASLLNSGGGHQGAYDEIVHRYLLCLASCIVGQCVCFSSCLHPGQTVFPVMMICVIRELCDWVRSTEPWGCVGDPTGLRDVWLFAQR